MIISIKTILNSKFFSGYFWNVIGLLATNDEDRLLKSYSQNFMLIRQLFVTIVKKNGSEVILFLKKK
jgi:hypothetical protein